MRFGKKCCHSYIQSMNDFPELNEKCNQKHCSIEYGKLGRISPNAENFPEFPFADCEVSFILSSILKSLQDCFSIDKDGINTLFSIFLSTKSSGCWKHSHFLWVRRHQRRYCFKLSRNDQLIIYLQGRIFE